MRYIKKEGFKDLIQGIVSEEHQIKDAELHLTVGKVFEIQGKGSIDFSGNEQETAKLANLEPSKKNPEDKYGWWELEKGTYIIKINEKINLTKDKIGIISPLSRTINSGAYVSTKIITPQSSKEISLILLTMSGINIKENARIARLLIIEI